ERAKAITAAQQDEEGQAAAPVAKEKASPAHNNNSSSSDAVGAAGKEAPSSDSPPEEDLVRNTSVFTWKNLTYTVKTSEGDRVLLDNVQGWVKPGMLGALMGSSGA